MTPAARLAAGVSRYQAAGVSRYRAAGATVMASMLGA